MHGVREDQHAKEVDPIADEGDLRFPQWLARDVWHQPVRDTPERHRGGRGHGEVEVPRDPCRVVHGEVHAVGRVHDPADATKEEQNPCEQLGVDRWIRPWQRLDPAEQALPTALTSTVFEACHNGEQRQERRKRHSEGQG